MGSGVWRYGGWGVWRFGVLGVLMSGGLDLIVSQVLGFRGVGLWWCWVWASGGEVLNRKDQNQKKTLKCKKKYKEVDK